MEFSALIHPYQIIYLVSVFTLTAVFVIFFPDLMLDDTSSTFVVVCSVIAVLANPVCELLISKQSRLNFLVDIFFIEVRSSSSAWRSGGTRSR